LRNRYSNRQELYLLLVSKELAGGPRSLLWNGVGKIGWRFGFSDEARMRIQIKRGSPFEAAFPVE
jgi:hypothetical protein